MTYARSPRGTLLVVLVVILFLQSGTFANSLSYLVTAQDKLGEASIHRLQDLNGDGDALDIGESTLWGSFAGIAGEIRSIGANAVITTDAASGRLLLLKDINGDGDALDIGEQKTWANGLGAVNGLDIDESRVVAADRLSGLLYELTDINNDGDALDLAERVQIAPPVEGAVSVLLSGEKIFVLSSNQGQIIQFRDTNGDGDMLDAGEALPYTQAGSLVNPMSLLQVGNSLYVSELTTGRVMTINDFNGDDDAMDITEVLAYAGSSMGMLDSPRSLTEFHEGGLLAIERDSGRVAWTRDINGDADALDQGEIVPFAIGLTNPIGIVQVNDSIAPSLAADFDNDGDVDGNDFLVWQRGESPHPLSRKDLSLWKANFVSQATDILGTNLQLPEPTTIVMLLNGLAVIAIFYRNC